MLLHDDLKPNENYSSPTPSLVCHYKKRGWDPIDHFARLAATLLGLELRKPSRAAKSRWNKLRRIVFTTPRGHEPWALLLAGSPDAIKGIVTEDDFNRPKQFRVLWIVDSFWSEAAPSARIMRKFDLVIFMQKGEAEFYERLAPHRTLFLGWGADALDLGSASAARPIDVLRVGRQPDEWEDDIRSRAACGSAGLHFAGRPPRLPKDPADLSAGHRDLCRRYAESKFVLASSNLVAPGRHTHPTKEYITGRWTDALAAGAVIAGVPPNGDSSVEDLLWDGAILEFDRIDLAHNVKCLKDAVSSWTPEVAAQNRREALIRLDWRWRLKALSNALDITFPTLEADLARLRSAITNTI